MAEAGKQVAAVFDGPAYLGLVSLSDISEAYLLMSATSKRKPAQSDAPKSALEYGRPAPRKD
jgi:hypothetical protein